MKLQSLAGYLLKMRILQLFSAKDGEMSRHDRLRSTSSHAAPGSSYFAWFHLHMPALVKSPGVRDSNSKPRWR